MKYIYGNWKMYLDFEESLALAKSIFKFDFDFKKIDLAIFPSFLALKEISKLKKSSKIKIGFQDFDYHDSGAFTGAVSLASLKKIGGECALVGHSERRHIFGEKDENIKNKFQGCLEKNILPILCIGEDLLERKNKKTKQILKKQIKNVLNNLDLKNKKFILAYEPVWAIGTNNPCESIEANKIIIFIKQELKKYTEEKIPVLYGGSVSYKNVNNYLNFSNIDGVLVGSESSKKENFIKMLKEILRK